MEPSTFASLPISDKIIPLQWHNSMSEFTEFQMTEPGPINKLPTEILLQIFKCLSLSDLGRVTRVNRLWNSVGIPILYDTIYMGGYGIDPDVAEKANRSIIETTFANKKLCELLKHVEFYTSLHRLSQRELVTRTYPNLDSLMTFSMELNCDAESCFRIMSAIKMPNLRVMHAGLRCEAAEVEFPALFSETTMRDGNIKTLEEMRYSRLRTRSEAARIRDQDFAAEDSFSTGPLEGNFNNTLIQNQLLMAFIHYFSALPRLKVLDLDIGVTHETLIDLRETVYGIFKTISEYLIARSPGGRIDPVPLRENLMLLQQQQFNELATDVADEITRRTTIGIDDYPIVDYLLPVDEFLPMRNQVRAKLSTLNQETFKDLATAIYGQLLRSYPRLSVPGYKYLFEPLPPFENPTLNVVPCLSLIERVRLLRVQPRESRDLSTMLLLRDMQAYVVPSIYECMVEYGMATIEKVRVRLVFDGPWIEVLIQRSNVRSEVQVVSFFPDEITTDDEKMGVEGSRWGVYAVYKRNKRAVSKCALLSMNEGRWKLVKV